MPADIDKERPRRDASATTLRHAIEFFVFVGLLLAGTLALNAQKSASDDRTRSTATSLGFIRDVDASSRTILFDDALFLTGNSAVAAAIRAGRCTPEDTSDCAPNDYFIQNDSPAVEPVRLAPNARIVLSTLHAEALGIHEEDVPEDQFFSLILDPSSRWRDIPYSVTRIEGEIVLVKEVYVP